MMAKNPEFEEKIVRNKQGEFSNKNKESKPTVGADANLPYGNETELTIKPGKPCEGYRGGIAWSGGKYEETKTLAPKEKVALMRKDIKQLQKEGRIPADWKVRISTGNFSGNWAACVSIETCRPFEEIPSYDNRSDNAFIRYARTAIIESCGGSCTREEYEAKRKELQEHISNGGSPYLPARFGGSLCVVAKSVETIEAENTIKAACEQYTYSDTDPMLDYFNTDGYITISIEQRQNND